jgi:hypothetical protein
MSDLVDKNRHNCQGDLFCGVGKDLPSKEDFGNSWLFFKVIVIKIGVKK